MFTKEEFAHCLSRVIGVLQVTPEQYAKMHSVSKASVYSWLRQESIPHAETFSAIEEDMIKYGIIQAPASSRDTDWLSLADLTPAQKDHEREVVQALRLLNSTKK
ncbi:MAG: hypothetical protein BWY98_00777 [Tenericutes bacterium ADurb.BinA155]|nr:MAG: hypothetical protein BWY98_00777 [Tenericutes bacterium ADurb.BinA155]